MVKSSHAHFRHAQHRVKLFFSKADTTPAYRILLHFWVNLRHWNVLRFLHLVLLFRRTNGHTFTSLEEIHRIRMNEAHHCQRQPAENLFIFAHNKVSWLLPNQKAYCFCVVVVLTQKCSSFNMRVAQLPKQNRASQKSSMKKHGENWRCCRCCYFSECYCFAWCRLLTLFALWRYFKTNIAIAPWMCATSS